MKFKGSNPSNVYWIDIFLVKMVILFEKRKINEKEARDVQFFKKNCRLLDLFQRSSGVGSDRSANCATTYAVISPIKMAIFEIRFFQFNLNETLNFHLHWGSRNIAQWIRLRSPYCRKAHAFIIYSQICAIFVFEF